jgi:hypothetical protein
VLTAAGAAIVRTRRPLVPAARDDRDEVRTFTEAAGELRSRAST